MHAVLVSMVLPMALAMLPSKNQSQKQDNENDCP